MRRRGKADRSFIRFTSLMLTLVASVSIAFALRSKSFGSIPYDRHMDEIILTVDKTGYRLRDLAVAIAIQEKMTQGQALAYDRKDPQKFWNIHANGRFIRLESKNIAMESALHDIIFYEMARADGLKLTPEEMVYSQNQQMDFWNDLEEEGRIRLGISMEECEAAFSHMALAQKKQQLLADEKGVSYEAYDRDGAAYQKLLKTHDYDIRPLWERLNYGHITVN